MIVCDGSTFYLHFPERTAFVLNSVLSFAPEDRYEIMPSEICGASE